MTDKPFDEGEFLVAGRLWLLIPSNVPTELGELCKYFLRAMLLRPDGTTGQHVVVFTDVDLARRFVERLGERGKVLRPVACETLENEIALVEKLLELGDTHLGFDPESTHVRSISIPRVLEGMRNRRK
jgi:hypothetical protein